jgi:hypothetical protein
MSLVKKQKELGKGLPSRLLKKQYPLLYDLLCYVFNKIYLM